MSPKYPRTPHLPSSPGVHRDDLSLKSIEHFLNKNVIITEKMDGSNVCLERDNVFARSHLSTPTHPSFDMLKAYHAGIKYNIVKDLQIFGEWLFAKHSIEYDNLPNYLMIFGVRSLVTKEWLSWENTEYWAGLLNTITVPIIKQGQIQKEKDLTDLISKEGLYGQREGFVIRLASSFPDVDFNNSVAKWVRENHIQSNDHWSNMVIVQNKLAAK